MYSMMFFILILSNEFGSYISTSTDSKESKEVSVEILSLAADVDNEDKLKELHISIYSHKRNTSYNRKTFESRNRRALDGLPANCFETIKDQLKKRTYKSLTVTRKCLDNQHVFKVTKKAEKEAEIQLTKKWKICEAEINKDKSNGLNYIRSIYTIPIKDLLNSMRESASQLQDMQNPAFDCANEEIIAVKQYTDDKLHILIKCEQDRRRKELRLLYLHNII